MMKLTSKEALKEIIENAQDMCEWDDWREDFKIIEKDLEILEILKNSESNLSSVLINAPHLVPALSSYSL